MVTLARHQGLVRINVSPTGKALIRTGQVMTVREP